MRTLRAGRPGSPSRLQADLMAAAQMCCRSVSCDPGEEATGDPEADRALPVPAAASAASLCRLPVFLSPCASGGQPGTLMSWPPQLSRTSGAQGTIERHGKSSNKTPWHPWAFTGRGVGELGKLMSTTGSYPVHPQDIRLSHSLAAVELTMAGSLHLGTEH